MIKYEKTTWVDGETVLKADHMKKIEIYIPIFNSFSI